MAGAAHLPVFALLPPPRTGARRLANLLMFAFPVLFGLLALTLGQDANWDLRNYHWYNAYALLNGRHGFDVLPSQTPFFYNPLLDVPFYLMARALPGMVVGFALGAAQGLNAVLLFLLAYSLVLVPSPRRRVLAAAALALLGMLGGGGLAQLGTTFNDNITSIGILGSLLLVVTHHERLFYAPMARALPLALLCGLPAGLAMGLKLTAVGFCVALVAACFAFSGPFLRRFRLAFLCGLGITAGVVVAHGAWSWFLYVHYGSPVFPYFNDLFGSPFAPPVSARDIKFVPYGFWDVLLFPFRFAAAPELVGEIPWRDWRIPMLYALLPVCALIALVAGRGRDSAQIIMPPQPAHFVLWFAAIAYAFWVLMFGIYRYLVPLEMLAPLGIVFAIGLLPLAPKTKSLLAMGLLLVAACSVQPGDWGRLEGWNRDFARVTVPTVENPENTMLLMAGKEPYSYVATFFPPAMPVVRVESNFALPGEDKGINKVIRQRLEAHKAAGGAFLLLIPRWQVDLGNGALAHFGLRADPASCRDMEDNLYEAPILCDVQKL
ncbi:MAG: hypothetical protein GC131_05235 [Alphaproteobacteria bacterium]|nr:hypothetical protein [Alphaproteobacteria bacterium]